LSSVAVLQAQLDRARQARDRGEITQAQYNEFASKQGALISQAHVENQQKILGVIENPKAVVTVTKSSGPEAVVAPPKVVENTYWQRTPEGPKTVSPSQALVSPPKSSGLPTFTGALPAENPVLIPTEGGGALVKQGYEVTKTETVETPQGVAKTFTVTPVASKTEVGVAAQFMGFQKFGLEAINILAERQFGKDSLGTKLVRAETQYGMSPLLSFGGGGMAAVESEAYGFANLATSVKASLETGKLQYKPYNENIRLAPTVSGSALSLLSGGEEAREFSRMPTAYQVGAGFGELGLFIAEGFGVGKVAGYGVKTYTKIAPKINIVADKVVGEAAWKVYDKGYRFIEPAYQKFNRASQALDVVDTRFGVAYKSGLSSVRYKVANPIIQGAVRTRAEVSTVASRGGDLLTGGVKRVAPETVGYVKTVGAPNLRQNLARYASPLTSNRLTKEVKMYNVVSKGRGAFKADEALKAVSTVKPFKAAIKRVPSGAKVDSSTLADIQLKSALNAERNLLKGGKVFAVEPAPVRGFVPKVSAKDVLVLKVKNAYGALSGKGLLKENFGFQELSGMSRSAKQKAVFDIRTEKLIGKIKGGPKGVASTKNISTFEALKLVKKVSKQSKPLSQIRGLSLEEISGEKGVAQLKSASKPLTVQLNRTLTVTGQKSRISGLPNLASAYPGSRARVVEEEEISYLTYPGKDLSIVKPQMSTRLESSFRSTSSFMSTQNIFTGGFQGSAGQTKVTPKSVNDFTQTTVMPTVTPKFKPSFTPKVSSVVVPDVMPTVTPKFKPSFTPKFSSVVVPDVMPTVTPKFKPSFTPKLSQGSKLYSPKFMSPLGVGGGSGGGGGYDVLSGKWAKRNTRIKSSNEMLKTFGFGGSELAKTVKVFDKVSLGKKKGRRKRRR